MGEQDVKAQALDPLRIEEFRADLGREVSGAIAPDSAVWPMTYGFMRSLLATIDHLNAQLTTARKGLEEVADGRCPHEPRCDYVTNGLSINSCRVATAYDTLAAIDEKGTV